METITWQQYQALTAQARAEDEARARKAEGLRRYTLLLRAGAIVDVGSYEEAEALTAWLKAWNIPFERKENIFRSLE